MVVSENGKPSLNEFRLLVDDATDRLNADANKRKSYYKKRTWAQLEDDVRDVLEVAAETTPFRGSIRKIGGQSFPDIVANKYYGVEVKSSRDESWITLGGSVNESTRVKDIERIFVTFGKLVDPIEFRSRPYEDCLFDVAVTHYPRYRIDMNLPEGQTLFDKMRTTYDDLRETGDPVSEIVDYYRSNLKEGESLWWTGAPKLAGEFELPMKMRFLRTLDSVEKLQLMIRGLALFPSVLSSTGGTKYEQFTMWLIKNYGVISPSMRDLFSAGGRGTIYERDYTFTEIPRVIMNVFLNNISIMNIIEKTDQRILMETWGVDLIEDDRIGQWIDLVSSVCSLENYGIKKVLNVIFYR